MVQPKIEINEFDLTILAGVAKNMTLKEMVIDLGGTRKTSFVQYRLARLEQLGYVKAVAGKARSRYLTAKGKEELSKYVKPEKIRDWRMLEESGD